MSPYRFRQFIRADLPLAARWLRTPEVVRWWGDPERELALVTQDLDEPAMRQWIVEHGGEPFAYVQAYRAGAWPRAHLRHLPADAQMIDAFIGEPAMLGRGHGKAFLSDFARRLIAEGAPAVAIDPIADNHRARRAYARAGFVGDEIVEAKEGPVVVMVFQQEKPPP
ncbi:MAG TPA: GNAT family N-acetyltransferase [Stellaceae bacterium]|nr:GNAT family N-acetyltransferase [Stellaceae bacterium]